METNADDEHSEGDKENDLPAQILKNLLFSSVVYFIGYMNWSITWIIIPLIISLIREEKKRKRVKRRNKIRRVALGKEKEVIVETLGELPAWVYFPDVQRADWVNRIIKQFWPNVNYYTRDFLKTFAEAKLRKNLEKYSLKGFKFERIVLGNVPFNIGGIIVYDNVSRDEIVMDLDVQYAGDCDIKFRLRGLNGGIKNFQLYGRLRVVLKPLIRTLPLVGGLQAFFLNKPEIDFELDGLAGILDMPGISDLIRKSVGDTVASAMVLPNKFPLKLSKEVSSDQLSTPDPAGVLRVHVVEARDLLKKDLTITGKGKSDPYACLVVGEQTSRTETIDNTVDPKWDYWCEFIILEYEGQQLNIDLWDKDTTEDEFLGKTSIEISNLITAGQSDLWLPLEGVKHGDLHVRCSWMTLSSKYADLQAAVCETQHLQLTHLNTALLIVFIDSATNLRQIRTSTKPDPYVQLQISKQTKTTKTVMRTVNPVWEEGFIFFVNNPDSDTLQLQIIDAKTEGELSQLTYNVSTLTNKDNLEFNKESFRLDRSQSDSNLVWSLHLKIFKNENFGEYLEGLEKYKRLVKERPLEKQLSDVSSQGSNSLPNTEHFDRNAPHRSSVMSNASSVARSSIGQIHCGQINMTLSYSTQRQRLIVVVNALSDMYYKDPSWGKDTYVKLYLLPDRNKYTKRKTSVAEDKQNPTFDEQFEYLISQGELDTKKLEVSAVERKLLKNSLLGQVIIDLGKLDLPYSGWFELGPRLKN